MYYLIKPYSLSGFELKKALSEWCPKMHHRSYMWRSQSHSSEGQTSLKCKDIHVCASEGEAPQRCKDREDGLFNKAMKEAIYVKMERPYFNQLSLSGSYSAVLSYPAASARFTPSVQRLPQQFTSLMGCDEGECQRISSISPQPRSE